MNVLLSIVTFYVPLYFSVVAEAEDLRPRFSGPQNDGKGVDSNDFVFNDKEINPPATYRQNPEYHNHPPYHDHPPYYHNHPPYHNHPSFHNHPAFQHNPDFHKDNSQVNPDSSPTRVNESCCSDEEDTIFAKSDGEVNINSSRGIPIDFIQTINKYSVNDLVVMNYIDGEIEEDGELFLSSRFGADERSAATIPKAAGCTPEMKTIKLKTSDDPSILYIPQCTKVLQCGGCCSHNLLSCQPNQTETLAYQVLKTQYNGNKKLKFLGKEVVGVEKHLSCHCGCKVKEENCNAYQEYRANECRCVCTNNDEEMKCYKNYNKKLWDPDLCTCQCRDILQCSSGYSFDQRECKCVPTPMRRRNAMVTDSPFLEDDIDEE